MQLYNASFSPNALRVRAVIYELGIDVEIIPVDIGAGGGQTPEFLKLNPNGRIPVLVDGDFVVWESRAINAYLAAQSPDAGLYPADRKQRAIIDQWSYWQAIHLGPTMQRINFERVVKPRRGRGQPDEAAITGELRNVGPYLDVFENGLSHERDWIAGPLSLADFALATTFGLRKASGISLETRPLVDAWYTRMEARDSWRRATAEMT